MHRRFALLLPTTLIALAFAASAAATTIDFEDLGANLPIANPDTGDPDYFYNGYSAAVASQPTDFASSGASFNNEFSNFGGGCCWQGWAYSQTTDATTPGFGNQYSAASGSGAGGSATYGVAFTGGVVGAQDPVSRITFDQPVSVIGAALNNTTYAALSMRDGDPFAKKFGGASGSDPTTSCSRSPAATPPTRRPAALSSRSPTTASRTTRSTTSSRAGRSST
jgi:hypothetical protein